MLECAVDQVPLLRDLVDLAERRLEAVVVEGDLGDAVCVLIEETEVLDDKDALLVNHRRGWLIALEESAEYVHGGL